MAKKTKPPKNCCSSSPIPSLLSLKFSWFFFLPLIKSSSPVSAMAAAGFDVHELFCHYNAVYFHDSLGACAVSWAHPSDLKDGKSTCQYYPEGGCEILISKSLSEFHSGDNLKNTLLHEMIHAYMCFNHQNNDHSDHGLNFQNMMNAINSSSIDDCHRPVGGYNISISHETQKKMNHFKCEACGDLVETPKSRGPSYNDCIETTDLDGVCSNPQCHWHSHRKYCSGSYRKVRELRGSTEVKSPKVEELIVGGMDKEPPYNSGVQSTARSNNAGESNNKHDKKRDTIGDFRQTVGDEAGTSGHNASSRDSSHKKLKLLNDNEPKAHSARAFQDFPKRVRTLASKNNEIFSRSKKRKLSKDDDGYTVIIEWLDVYAVEEEEDEEPLINKRTERRKRQKLLQVNASNNNAADDDAFPSGINDADGNGSSYLSGPRNDNTVSTKDLVGHEQKFSQLQIHEGNPSVVGTSVSSNDTSGTLIATVGVPSKFTSDFHADLKNEGGQCDDASSPLNSPVRGIIVDISD